MAFRSRQPAVAAKKSILKPVAALEGHTKSVPSISYIQGGKRMISGSCDRTAMRWNLEAGKEIEKVQNVDMQEVHAVAISRDGQWVVMGGGPFLSAELRVCEVETGIVRRFEGHSRRITCIDISEDSTLLASGSYDSTVRIWSLDTGELVAGPFQIGHWVGAVRFSHGMKKIAVKSNCLEIWDVQTQKLDVKLGNSHFLIHRSPLFWTTEDKTIVAAFSFTKLGFANIIYEFDASTLETVGTPFKGHTDTINGLALSSDCALLASGSDDLTIKLWAFESRQLLASFRVLNPRFIIFSPDSRQLAYTAVNSTNIYLCNTPPEILARFQPAQQVPQRTSAPIFTPLAHLPNSDAAHPAAVHRNPTIDWAWAQTPGEPRGMAGPTSRGGRWTKSWNVKHAGTPRIQPADMWPSTDMRRQHYDPALQSLPQDFPYAHGGPALALPNTTTSPDIAPLPLPRRSSPAIGLRLPQSYPHPREFLPSSSHMDTVPPVRNYEPGDPSLDTMLQNLTVYITKDEEYPAARGGFGEIWKCTYSIDRRLIKVAVKALQVYTADQIGPAKMKKNKRIKRELKICASLKHKNILPVYGYTYGFGPFIALVSPWAENGNLTAYLERMGVDLTVLRRFEILRDIIAGLQYLHANSVIHGDFNGLNVLIYADGTACVADFGLSLMYSEVISASQASWTSAHKGNARWTAPELLVPDQEDGSPTRPSEQSDIFSFGGIMLQVLTNKIPYYYLPNDASIVLCIARSEKPSRIRYPVLLEKYWQFIEACWSTDPRDRPSTEGADAAIRNEFYSLSRF